MYFSINAPFSSQLGHRISNLGRAPSSGVTQEVLGPFLEGEQEQSENDCLEADSTTPFNHNKP
jgi:hypothetical protein